MISLQALNKILDTGSFSIVEDNGLTRDYFAPYQQEFDFIRNHFYEYHKVPDIETFCDKFPDFQLFDVRETDEYILNTLNEEYLYSCAVPVIQQSADILKGNALDAVKYLMSKLPELNKQIGIKTVDIIHDARSRYDEYYERFSGSREDFFIPTGFEELDNVINGWNRTEELAVLFARPGQGKSWTLTKTLSEACMRGFNAGCISPEMSANQLGYRFDTLTHHFNNSDLYWGNAVPNYEEYINNLSNMESKFCISTPRDFGNEVTVSKIRAFIQKNDIHILGIDGITYMRDERATKYDNTQAQLTHISEDLFQLSSEFHIPIIIVVQSNREGVKASGGELDLTNVRDADGINFNATKVISIRQKRDEEILELNILKNRYGRTGLKFIYLWNIPMGDFVYVPAEDDGNEEEDRDEKIVELQDKFRPTGEDVPF